MSWELTRWGRIDQGRRELAVVLGKDVSVDKFAELIGLSGPSLQGWKQGSRPKEASMEALERVFLGAGLARYTRRYIDYGSGSPESIAETVYRDQLQQAEATKVAEPEPPYPVRRTGQRKPKPPRGGGKKRRGA